TNGKYYNSFNVSFTEPWLGGKKPNALSIAGYRSSQSNGVPRSDATNSSIVIWGGSVGLGKRLGIPDDYFSLFYEMNYQYYQLHNYTSGFLFNNGFAHNVYLSITLSRNSIDAPIYPRSGSQISLTGMFTPPYST